jgi:hypothetical protein
MAGTLTISTLSDGTNSTSATNCIQGSAKAWVNFNGTGTVAIRASYNVSSITDNGTGDYTVNLTNAMSDASYSATLGVSAPTGASAADGILRQIVELFNYRTSSAMRICTGYTYSGGYSVEDEPIICVSIFR